MSKFLALARGVVLALLVLAPLCSVAWAGEGLGEAKLVVSKAPGGRVLRILWDQTTLSVRETQLEGKSQLVVDLRGVLEEKNGTLVHDGAKVPLHDTADGPGFSLSIPLTGRETFVNLMMLGKHGKTAQEEIDIVYDAWGKPRQKVTKESPASKRFFHSAGASLTSLRYAESGSATQNVSLLELGLTGKYNALYLLEPGKWELSGNLFGTLVPIELSPGGLAAARWYGANMRAGYRLPVNSVKATQFWVMTGWYFWGMWGMPAGSYGIQYLSGPEIFLNSRIELAGSKALSVYFKYASISDFSDLFSLSNREVALGGAVMVGKLWKTHPLGVTLDISDAKYSNSTLTENMHLVSIGLGANFGL